jgi:OHCU decarboxylase
VRLSELNALGEDAAVREFLRCCGSPRWARAMAAARPFAGVEAMLQAADDCWKPLAARDFLDAFAAHPKIGQSGRAGRAGRVGPARGPRDADWSAEEQAGARSASDDVLERLAAGNRAYEARFGYIFIICATGKSAAEMLAALETRLHHGAVEELRIAAEEQRKITRLRLVKLVDDDRTP